MYQGEVHIGQEQLKEFLKAAQLLQVRGLTDVPPTAPIPTLDQKASPVSLLCLHVDKSLLLSCGSTRS